MKRRSANSSIVWEYFEKIGPNKAACKLCGAVMSRNDGSTSSLKNHLTALHGCAIFQLNGHGTKYELQQGPDPTMVLGQEIKQEEIANNDNCAAPSKQTVFFPNTTPNKRMRKDDHHPKTAEDFDNALCEWIAIDDLPFNLLDAPGFVHYHRKILPQYQIKPAVFYKAKLLDMYDRMKERIADEISSVTCNGLNLILESVTCDQETLIIISIRSLTEDFVRKQFVYYIERVPNNRNDVSKRLIEALGTVLNASDVLKGNINLILNGTEIDLTDHIRLMALTNYEKCTVKNLNEIIHHAILSHNLVQDTLSTCRRIVRHFNESLPATIRLEQIQISLNPQNPPLMVIEETSISSSHTSADCNMLKCLFDLRQYITAYAAEQNLTWTISWNVVSDILELLSLFKQASDTLRSPVATVGDVLPCITWLKSQLNSYKIHESDLELFAQSLKDGIGARFKDIQNRKCYALATLIDPKFKNKLFTPSETEMLIKQIEFEINEEMLPIKIKPEPFDSAVEPSTSKSVTFLDFISEKCNIATEYASQTSNPSISTVRKEIYKFLKGRGIAPTEDSLTYWNNHAIKFPNLACMARRYLAPPGSACNKRTAPAAGNLFQKIGSTAAHDDDMTDRLLFLRYNL